MGVKYILLFILILIGIISIILILPAEAQQTPHYRTTYLRDLSFKEYKMTYKFVNNPTRAGTADTRYTESLYKHFEKINDATEKKDVGYKKKDHYRRKEFDKDYPKDKK
jgi:hypothetical protein